jgi:hypothetical protein
MRYGLDSTLPINAFSPRATGPFALGMTLEGGGGGIPIVSDVVNAVSDVGQSIANVVSDAGATIDKAVIQPAVANPIATVATVAAIATGNPELLPLISATNTVAQGGDLQQVATNAALAYGAGQLGAGVAGGLSDTLGTVASNVAGGSAAGGALAAAKGGDVTTGLLAGAINSGINQGVGAAVDAGAGLLTPTASADSGSTPGTVTTSVVDTGTTNTGTTNMDPTTPNYADLGFSDQAAADAAWAQAQAEFDAAGGYAGSYAPSGYGTADGTALGNATEIQNFTGDVAASGLDSGTITNLIKQYGTQAVKALIGAGGSTLSNAVSSAARRAQLQAQGYTPAQINAMDNAGGLLGAGANYFLNQNQLGQLSNAYGQNVAAQQAATQTAQQQASFKPVGITTAFGQSNFQFDPTTGQMTSAGYTPTAQVAGQVQNLFGLGAQALPTTTNTQDIQNQYIAQQQGLLAPGREQQLAGINNQQWQTGRTGLATGGTTAGYAAGQPGLMQTNPELAAYYNSIGQQNAQIAANAPTYAQNLLNSQIATGTGLFGAANTLEGYAQQPLTLSSGLGTAASGAGAKAGYYGLLGNQAAQQTQLQGQLAGIYGQGAALGSAVNPLVSAAGNAIGQWLA